MTAWPRRGGATLTVLAAVLSLAACGGSPPANSTPSPPAAQVANLVLPDYNSRLGSNRVAAEAAVRIGRSLYGFGQYWEVYVRTDPVTPTGTYDPADPAAAAPIAAQVRGVDLVLATESAAAVQAFSAGGEGHERQVLSAIDAGLRQDFPNLGTDTVHVYYGESFQHGVATFDHGNLVSYAVRKLG